jgi:hypothetical protein
MWLTSKSGFMTDIDLVQLRKTFGPCDEFIKSIGQNEPNIFNAEQISNSLPETIEMLALCDYEKHSLWGKQART